MIASRWKKIAGDIVACQGRLVMMTLAIAVGVFAVTAIATAYAILDRELDGQYLATNPATALLDVDHLSEAALAEVRRRPGVVWAELGGRVSGRVEVANGVWLPLLLFILPDFADQRIAKVRLVEGRWPTQPEGIVLERTAVALANSALNRELTVETPNGQPRSLRIAGVVHDPSLAPAWQQQTVYGYATPATLSLLGEDAAHRVLKLWVRAPDADARGAESIVVDAATWLRHEGHDVGEIRMPPHHHPHQGQMTGVIRMLLGFGILTLALSAILTATLTASLLAPQVRQMAVMKAIGASTSQIAALYIALVAGIGLIAAGIGMPLGVAGGRALAANVARMLNLELVSRSVPFWIFLVLTAAGVGLPLLLALQPIFSGARRSVREALNDFGASPRMALGLQAPWTRRITLGDPALVLALRNMLRRRRRLLLTLALLGGAGGMYLTALNLKASWHQNLIDAVAERHYDIEIKFAHPGGTAAAVAAAREVPGIERVEPFDDEPAARERRDGLDIVKTFPDGGHGSLKINSLPWDTAFVSPTIIEGRWLRRDDAAGAVLNTQALEVFPGLKIGDPIAITVAGRPLSLILEGVIREHMAGATIYTPSGSQGSASSEPRMTTGLRIGLKHDDRGALDPATAAIVHALENAQIKVAQTLSRAQLGDALAGHQFILIFILILMSVLMAIVGLLGLGAAIATGVLERAREFAVLRAIGAGNSAILRTVIAEGICVGVLSVVPALLLSLPLSAAVAGVVGAGKSSSAVYFLSPPALPLWLGLMLIGSAAASAYPAWRASRLTIREALTEQ